jgi:chromosome segregation ATPase
MNWRALRPACVVASLALGACVPTGRFDAAVADGQTAHAALGRERVDQEEILKICQDLDAANAQIQSGDQELSDLSTRDHNLQSQLDEQTVINAKLRAELERLGKNVDEMLREKGTLTHSLEDAKARLAELRKAQAAAEARTRPFQQFVEKFKALTDTGQLKITTRNGRLVLHCPTTFFLIPDRSPSSRPERRL